MNEMGKPIIFFEVLEDLNGTTECECCPQCGSVGVVHFEDSTSGTDTPHRCLKCGWAWDGCTFSNGKTPQGRLNDIRMN